MQALGLQARDEAVLRTLTDDVLKSSEIEGERLDADQVRSSVARRLGLDVGGLTPADRHVEGVVEMMLDATQRYDHPLTTEPARLAHVALPYRPKRHASHCRGCVARRLALRDIQQLVERGVLVRGAAGGRSTATRSPVWLTAAGLHHAQP